MAGSRPSTERGWEGKKSECECEYVCVSDEKYIHSEGRSTLDCG